MIHSVISESGIGADLSSHSIRSTSSQEDACTQTTLRRPKKYTASAAVGSAGDSGIDSGVGSNTVGTYTMCSENVICLEGTDVKTDAQGSHLVSTNVSIWWYCHLVGTNVILFRVII